MDKAAGETETLLHSSRKRLNKGILFDREVCELEDFIDDLVALRNAVDAGEEVEVLPDFDVVIEAEEVGHVADHPADFHRLVDDIDSVEGSGSAGWLEKGGEHADGGRFARAIAADKAEDIAWF